MRGVIGEVVVREEVRELMGFEVKFVGEEGDKMRIVEVGELVGKEKGMRIMVWIKELEELGKVGEYKDMEGKMGWVWEEEEVRC